MLSLISFIFDQKIKASIPPSYLIETNRYCCEDVPRNSSSIPLRYISGGKGFSLWVCAEGEYFSESALLVIHQSCNVGIVLYCYTWMLMECHCADCNTYKLTSDIPLKCITICYLRIIFICICYKWTMLPYLIVFLNTVPTLEICYCMFR